MKLKNCEDAYKALEAVGSDLDIDDASYWVLKDFIDQVVVELCNKREEPVAALLKAPRPLPEYVDPEGWRAGLYD